MSQDDFRLEFDDDGTLNIRGREGWREPICPVCGEPIKWVLDIASFGTLSDGSYTFGHARCLWTREGIEDVARKVAAL